MKHRIATSALAAGLVLAVAPAALAAQAAAPAGPSRPPPKVSATTIATFAKLPDWTGVWEAEARPRGKPTGNRTFGSVFDLSGGPPGAPATPGARDYPPYNAEWEARYTKFLNEVTWASKGIDPLTLCYPPGFPRLAIVPFGMQFVVRPDATWIIYERNPVRFIFTDGRQHPNEDEIFPSWEGHSIGHWEGDTLVVDTVGLKGGMMADRTGLVFSDKLHITERIRRISEDQLEDVMTLIDPISMTKPWVVPRYYNQVKEKYASIGNIACAESQRNPIVGGENTVVLGSERKGATGLYPPEIAPFATPAVPDKP